MTESNITSGDIEREALHVLISDTYRRARWGTDAFEAIAVAILAEFLPDHDKRVKAEATREAAASVRRNATAPFALIHPVVQIDALIAWVADWIEDPPEWVLAIREASDD